MYVWFQLQIISSRSPKSEFTSIYKSGEKFQTNDPTRTGQLGETLQKPPIKIEK